MGLLGLLIAVIVLIFIFVFSFLSNSPTVINPNQSQKVTTQAKDAFSSQEQKNKIEREQIKNIDLP